VFGDVVRHGRGGQVGAGCGQTDGAADRASVGLGPEPHDTPKVIVNCGQLLCAAGLDACGAGVEPVQVCVHVQGDGVGGLADGLAQQRGIEPGWWRLVVPLCGVQADHGVVVDDAAGLVLGDLDEPDPDQLVQLLTGQPGQAGELAGHGDGEPPPQ